jgi:ABC-type nitrate/sulfonate/bicarbonate transport system substrate-binding protein
LLKKYELNEKEVSYVFTGGTGGSFAALASEQVAGAVLVSPYDDKAVSKGFKKFMMIGDLLDIPTAGLIATRAEVTNNRDRVQKTIAAVVDAIAWIRNKPPDTANLIAAKFKITVSEANGTYDTLLSMLNKDGRLPLKVVHGYLDILRRERPIPADIDPQKFLDFSMLPGGK